MNRKLVLSGLAVFAVMFFITCSGKKDESNDHSDHQPAGESWKEMDNFHMIMAESFHPFKDSMNLAPAKLNASEMAAEAEKWSAAPLPEKVNNDDMKSKLEQLKTQSASFVEVVAKGDDKVIGEELTKLHDQFHEIQEAWYGGHGEHHH